MAKRSAQNTDGRRHNGANLVPPDKKIIKDNEETEYHESQWIDRDKIAPRLVRLLDIPCWPEAELQLMAGMPIADVANYIQVTRGEGKWLTRYSMIEYLKEMRKSAPIVMRQAAMGPTYREKLHKRWGDRTLILDGLYKQLEDLSAKIDKIIAMEQVSGHEDNDTLNKFWNSYVKLAMSAHTIQKELGLVSDRMPETKGISVEIIQMVRAEAGEDAVKALQDPSAQGRVLEALRRARQAAAIPGSGLDETMDYKYREIYGDDDEDKNS